MLGIKVTMWEWRTKCENAGVVGLLENDGNAAGVPEGAIENDGNAAGVHKDGLEMNNEEETQPADESEEREVLRNFKKGLWTQTLSMKKSLYQHKIINLLL
ncbi:hypothetical protein Fot_06177 [Forsythia ovata]|uniref:Uncharacterized protein n=1 Tax=Forsythia ovata TaxID=205694 RepID=A0ABD1WVA4_9LAMI